MQLNQETPRMAINLSNAKRILFGHKLLFNYLISFNHDLHL